MSLGARCCKPCDRRWPDSQGYGECPLCDRVTTRLPYVTAPNVEEVAVVLTQLAEMADDLERAEADARRRGPRWTVVDVLLETPMLDSRHA